MHIRRRRGWEISDTEATPEGVFLKRRTLLAGSAAGLLLPGLAAAQGAPRNPLYDAGRPLTVIPAKAGIPARRRRRVFHPLGSQPSLGRRA